MIINSTNYRTGSDFPLSITKLFSDIDAIQKKPIVDVAEIDPEDFDTNFSRVEYLGTTGLQYVVTDYIPNVNTDKMRLVCQITDSRTSTDIWPALAEVQTLANGTGANFGSTYVPSSKTFAGKNYSYKIYDVLLGKMIDHNEIVEDGDLITGQIHVNSTNDTITKPLVLFYRHNNSDTLGTEGSIGIGRIHSLEAYENDELIHKYIPAVGKNKLYTATYNKSGYFDMVTKKFFTNSGTWQLLRGPLYDCDPNDYQRVEYIESTGNQFIDIGYIPKPNTRVVIDQKFNDISTTALSGMNHTSNSSSTYIGFGWGINKGGSANYGFEFNVMNAKSYSWNNAGFLDADRHIWDMQSGSQKIDNVEYSTMAFDPNYKAYLSLSIFARKIEPDKNVDWYSKGRVYGMQIYEDGEMVYNLEPRVSKISGEGGLYNTLTNKFYIRNDGSSPFNIGDEIN